LTMKCKLTGKELSAYIDGEVSASARVRIERHVARCPECDRYMKELSLVVESVRRLGRIEPSATFSAEMMRRVKTSKALPAPRKAAVRKLAVAFASCAAVGMFILGWLILSANRSGPSRPDVSLTEMVAATLLVDNGGDLSFDVAESTIGRGAPDELTLLVTAAYSDDTPIEEMMEMLSDSEKTEFRTVLVSLAQEEN